MGATTSYPTVRRGALGLVAVLGMVLTACGDGTSVGTSAGDETSTTMPGSEDVMLTCGEGLPFPLSALDGPTGAENGTTPEAEALRGVIARREGPPEEDGIPATGWRLLAEGPYGYFFGAGQPPRMAMVTIWLEDGVLDAGPAGVCVTRRYREGFDVPRWKLHEVPLPDATELVVDVTESSCASGEAPGDRLQPPEVVEDEGSVTLTFWIKSLVGDQDCPGNPSTTVTVPLEQALVGRNLLDGGRYQPVEVPDSRPPATTVPGGSSSTSTTEPVTTTTGSPPPDEAAAITAIEEAYRIAWDGSLTQEQRLARVERGWETAEAGNEVTRRYPAAVASVRAEVTKVRFLSLTRAAVEFSLIYSDAPQLPKPQEGEAVLVDGRWKVSFETRCNVIRQTLVDCP